MLSGLGEKDFIRDLMPRHPIYATLLPPAAQAAIGRVHAEAEPAWRLLVNEGLAPGGEVDIFDAGPLLAATLATVRTVREIRRGSWRGETWEPTATTRGDPGDAGPALPRVQRPAGVPRRPGARPPSRRE